MGCDGDSVLFQVTNVGDAPMTRELNYVIVEDGIMLREVPFVSPALEAGEVFPVRLPSDGTTYHLITNQEPNAPANPAPTAVSEGCNAAAGGFTTGLTNILALDAGPRTTDVVCIANVGAYDPNDKRGFPLGRGEEGRIEPGTRLDYVIRFQNTGTDTAFTVVLRDTLPAELDLATLKLEGATHDHRVHIDSQRVLTYVFENIQLPDSSVNLAASQGAVRFSIDHVADAPLGTVLRNEAAIYFDFNDPIITEPSVHTLSDEGLPVSLRGPGDAAPVRAYPNPTTDHLRIDLPADAELLVRLTDFQGRQVAEFRGSNEVELSGLPPAPYVLTVRSGGKWYRAVVVVK